MRGKDGLYRGDNAILCFRYKDPDDDDKWKEKSTGLRGRKEARDFRTDFLTKLKSGELPNKKSEQTVEVACARWVEQHKTSGAKGGLTSIKARKNEGSYLRQLIKHLGAKRLKTITLDDLKEYQRLRSEGDEARNLKAVKGRPINCELGILVNVLRESNLWYGPLKNYKRLSEGEEKAGNALTPEQKQLLEVVAGSRDSWQVAYLAFLLAVNAGTRGVEIKRLQLRHVDWDKRQLTIEHAKTPKGNRTIELNTSAFSAVTKLWVRAQQLGAREPGHYLLPADLSRHTKDGDPLKPKGVGGFDVTKHQESWDTAWRNLRAAAVDSIKTKAAEEKRELRFSELRDIEVLGHIGFHSMRRTFVTRMAEKNVPLPVTMEMIGHMSAKMTERYTRISSTAQRRAVELLDPPTEAAKAGQEKPATEERVYRN